MQRLGQTLRQLSPARLAHAGRPLGARRVDGDLAGTATRSLSAAPPATWHRYLDRDERYELARLLEVGHSQREIADRMGRSPSTICRELARNRDPRTGEYQPERAHTLAWQRQRRPKTSKIGSTPVLRTAVQQMLDKRHSPDQIAGRLKVLHPDNDQMQVSHESIYLSIYVYPRGELTRELKATLRSGRVVRRPRGSRRSGAARVGVITNMVSIRERPEEVEGRVVPGHHEGDSGRRSARTMAQRHRLVTCATWPGPPPPDARAHPPADPRDDDRAEALQRIAYIRPRRLGPRQPRGHRDRSPTEPCWSRGRTATADQPTERSQQPGGTRLPGRAPVPATAVSPRSPAPGARRRRRGAGGGRWRRGRGSAAACRRGSASCCSGRTGRGPPRPR